MKRHKASHLRGEKMESEPKSFPMKELAHLMALSEFRDTTLIEYDAGTQAWDTSPSLCHWINCTNRKIMDEEIQMNLQNDVRILPEHPQHKADDPYNPRLCVACSIATWIKIRDRHEEEMMDKVARTKARDALKAQKDVLEAQMKSLSVGDDGE